MNTIAVDTDPHPSNGHDHPDSDPGHLYKEEWVKKLLRQIEDFLQTESDWLGVSKSEPQRVLDYACGNGTVSRALLNEFPKTLFQGLDIARSQVRRFNDEAEKLLGTSYKDRLFAIQGDLNEPNEALGEPQWVEFDAVIISMALHHVTDPAGFLKKLKERVKSRGLVIILDFLRQSPTTARAGKSGGEQGYAEADMTQLSEGMKVWPGFTLEDIHADLTAAGCSNVEVKIYNESVDAPQEMEGYNKMFIAKAKVM
ncbi:hypothetical protein DL770_008530 [Monosporascus sp. CRB-9-2]|nr:hypothetical protein DL770_008530 [Monosporascus sp. CRB-9-2]